MPAPLRSVRGVPVPTFMYGTAWKEDRTETLVRHALAAGFRAIDTANQRKHYFEAGVGAAIAPFLADGRRAELFLQTKFTFRAGQDERLPYDPAAPVTVQVWQSFESSLEHLGVEYLDSLVLHGPSQHPGLGAADQEAWAAMEELFDDGRVRLLGVSNVSLAQLRMFWEEARIKPAFVQNRCYADRAWDADIRAFCAQHGVVYQGFSLLTANRAVWNHREVAAIARERDCTPAQVLFMLAIALDMLPLTGTTDPAHMARDLAVAGTPLPDADVQRILAL
ncbi:MAG: aldo/keto reductase [Alphaproteobacteria bacterium]|nr:aldo/keto reductase [Alphaproteobacteria bacterium]